MKLLNQVFQVHQLLYKSIKNYLADQKKHNAQLDNLEAEKQEALREVTKLRKTFAKHDLGNLALNKPKLIEKISQSNLNY